MSLFESMRDKAVEALIRRNELIARFGEIQSVEIDSFARVATVSMLLKGEYKCTQFSIDYDFEEDCVIVQRIHCDREWIEEISKMWFSSEYAQKHPLKKELSGITKAAKLFL